MGKRAGIVAAIILSITTIVAFIFLSYYYRKSMQNETNWKECKNNIKSVETLLRINEYQDSMINDLWLSKVANINLISNENVLSDLNDIITNEKLVIWFHHYKACNECIEKTIKLLNEYAGVINPDNIILISNFESQRELKSFVIKLDVKFQCFRIDARLNNLLDHDNGEIAQAFIMIDRRLRILFPFLIKDNSEGTRDYLERISKFLADL